MNIYIYIYRERERESPLHCPPLHPLKRQGAEHDPQRGRGGRAGLRVARHNK